MLVIRLPKWSTYITSPCTRRRRCARRRQSAARTIESSVGPSASGCDTARQVRRHRREDVAAVKGLRHRMAEERCDSRSARTAAPPRAAAASDSTPLSGPTRKPRVGLDQDGLRAPSRRRDRRRRGARCRREEASPRCAARARRRRICCGGTSCVRSTSCACRVDAEDDALHDADEGVAVPKSVSRVMMRAGIAARYVRARCRENVAVTPATLTRATLASRRDPVRAACTSRATSSVAHRSTSPPGSRPDSARAGPARAGVRGRATRRCARVRSAARCRSQARRSAISTSSRASSRELDAPDARLQRLAVHGVVELQPLLPAPALHEVPRRQQAVVVVEDALDQRRHGEHQLGRLAVDRSASRCSPSGAPRGTAWSGARSSPPSSRARPGSRSVQNWRKVSAVMSIQRAVADDEVHRHVERVLDVVARSRRWVGRRTAAGRSAPGRCRSRCGRGSDA